MRTRQKFVVSTIVGSPAQPLGVKRHAELCPIDCILRYSIVLMMILDYLDAKNQIYVPAALLLVGGAITKPEWLPYVTILTGFLVWLKINSNSTFRAGQLNLICRTS